ncbi:MAG: DUF6427 family protein [Bacteroidota bacterium]
MVNILKSNQPFVIVFILLSAVGLWIFNLIDPVVYEFAFDQNKMIFYNIASQFFSYKSFGSILTTFILLVFQGFLLVQFNRKYILINYRTYLPAFFYILIASSFVPIQRINPVIFGTLFVFIATNFIYDIYRRDYALNRLYMAGFFVSLASLFWAPFAAFFLVIWIALTILRPFIGREWIVSLFGFITPFLFVFTYYYVFVDVAQLNMLVDDYLNHFKILRVFNPIHYAYYIFYALLFLIVLFASFTVLSNYQKKKIKTRKYFEINWWMFFIGIILFVFFNNVGYEILFFISIPISFLITEYFYTVRVNWFLNILLLLLLGSLVHIQIIAHY